MSSRRLVLFLGESEHFFFDIAKYSNNPSIPTIRFKTIIQLQQQFPNALSPTVSWQMLLDSIPNEWKNLIRHGNQTFDKPEFFAVTSEKDQMGPVYFNNLGVLTLHTLDVSNGNL